MRLRWATAAENVGRWGNELAAGLTHGPPLTEDFATIGGGGG